MIDGAQVGLLELGWNIHIEVLAIFYHANYFIIVLFHKEVKFQGKI